MDEAFLDVTEAVDRELLVLNDDGGAAAATAAASAPHDHCHQDDDDEEATTPAIPFIGHLYQGRASGRGQRPCRCGCRRRLAVGSRLADAMRAALKAEVGCGRGGVALLYLLLPYPHPLTKQTNTAQLGFTSCAGVSANKLLAKLAAGLYKPDAQTTLLPVSGFGKGVWEWEDGGIVVAWLGVASGLGPGMPLHTYIYARK
jgi:nucleotidyltransferase/DNA polymerase involved in DNA repair